jgi:hypothetical protein
MRAMLRSFIYDGDLPSTMASSRSRLYRVPSLKAECGASHDTLLLPSRDPFVLNTAFPYSFIRSFVPLPAYKASLGSCRVLLLSLDLLLPTLPNNPLPLFS